MQTMDTGGSRSLHGRRAT